MFFYDIRGHSMLKNKSLLLIITLIISLFELRGLFVAYELDSYTIGRAFENMAQWIYHASAIFFLGVAITKRFSSSLYCGSLIIGSILFEFEILDVLVFEYLLKNNILPATNPLTVKLLFQMVVFGLLIFNIFRNGRINLVSLFSSLIMGGILVVMFIYHLIFAAGMGPIFQERNLKLMETYMTGSERDFRDYCIKLNLSCYTFNDGIHDVYETKKYYVDIDLFRSIDKGEVLIGYDPLITKSARIIKDQKEVRLKPNSKIALELENFFVEYDAAFGFYNAGSYQRMVFDVDNYQNLFRTYVKNFYVMATFMLLFWFFGGIILTDFHYKKILRKK